MNAQVIESVTVSEEPTTFVRFRMTRPVIMANLDTPLGSVEHLLAERKVSCVPVVDNGRLAGIITSTDLIRSPLAPSAPASALMTSPVAIAHPDERIEEAAYRMVALRIHRLVVIGRDERVVGILSAQDLLEEVMSRRNEQPLAGIMSAPVESISVGDTIDEALSRLASANVHGIAVMDGTKPIGVFTHLEALSSRRLAEHLRSRPVEEMMSDETLCLDSATTLRRAAAFTVAMNARRVLVTEGRRVVGIVTPFDLLRAIVMAVP